jgi:hypothetical protein
MIAQLVKNLPPLKHNFDCCVGFEVLIAVTLTNSILSVKPLLSYRGLFKLQIVRTQNAVTSFITLFTACCYLDCFVHLIIQ